METEPKAARGVVAIVGRPNVGKSSVFNRLIGRRLAIVHEERGVTRDRIVQEASWDGVRYDLMDTGGVGRLDADRQPENHGLTQIEIGIRQQVQLAVQDASAIIFVTDIEAGVVPEDEEVVELLRRCGRPVFVAANKADTASRDTDAVDFEQFGFPVYPVSALHKRGFDGLMEVVVRTLPRVDESVSVVPLRVALIGRPNVGKSSLINRLLCNDRVLVSDIPGTTRDSIDIPFAVGKGSMARHYILTDTAGLKRSGKIRTVVDRFSLDRAEGSIRRSDIAALVLDAAQGPAAYDKTIASMILKARKGCVIAVNKWDLLPRCSPREYEEALRSALPFLDFVPVMFVSAKTGFHVRLLIQMIDDAASRVQSRLPTGILNRILVGATERVQPPMVRGRRLKLYYAVQLATKPVTLGLFVNDPGLMVPAFEQYLIHAVRAAFTLDGAPVVLRLRTSHGKSSDVSTSL